MKMLLKICIVLLLSVSVKSFFVLDENGKADYNNGEAVSNENTDIGLRRMVNHGNKLSAKKWLKRPRMMRKHRPMRSQQEGLFSSIFRSNKVNIESDDLKKNVARLSQPSAPPPVRSFDDMCPMQHTKMAPGMKKMPCTDKGCIARRTRKFRERKARQLCCDYEYPMEDDPPCIPCDVTTKRPKCNPSPTKCKPTKKPKCKTTKPPKCNTTTKNNCKNVVKGLNPEVFDIKSFHRHTNK